MQDSSDCLKVRGFEVVSSCIDIVEKSLLPRRATAGSAGYDFFAIRDEDIPQSIISDPSGLVGLGLGGVPSLKPYLVKTGIKAYMRQNEGLFLFSRSSAPMKYGLTLANAVGVVDSDYYNNSDNEGEIGFLFYNLSKYVLHINKGDKIGQGIFLPIRLADSDVVTELESRTGGFGSTGD